MKYVLCIYIYSQYSSSVQILFKITFLIKASLFACKQTTSKFTQENYTFPPKQKEKYYLTDFDSIQ